MILETERLYLRKLNQNDFGSLCKILQDKEVMYAYEHAFSDEEVLEWLNRQLERYNQYGFGLWAVCLKENDALIGQCGLTMQPCMGREVLEIGYLFQKRYWHMGYATEAAKACKSYAFDVLHADEVYSIIRDNNLASQKVAERNGMTVCGSFTKHYYGIDMTHLVYKSLKNYFYEVNPNCESNSFDFSKRADPDSVSKSLYYDVAECFFRNNRLPNGNPVTYSRIKLKKTDNSNRYYELEICFADKYIVGLGADYIGPSVSQALKKGINNKEILDFLKITRTLAGHILFPRWIKNINTKAFSGNLSLNIARASRPFHDRFDLFLSDLKKWYSNDKCILEDCFRKNSIWLNQFETFEGFVDFFNLKGSFTDDTYSIVKMSEFPSSPEDYENYISNTVRAIKIRSESIKHGYYMRF